MKKNRSRLFLSAIICILMVIGTPLTAFAQESDSAQTGAAVDLSTSAERVKDKVVVRRDITVEVGKTNTFTAGIRSSNGGATWMYKHSEGGYIKNPMDYPGFNTFIDGYRRNTWYFISASVKYISNHQASFSITGLKPGKTCVQFVLYYDDTTDSNYYVEHVVTCYITVIPASPTPTPAKPAATSLATPRVTKLENTAAGVKLTWGKVSGAAKYRVYYNNGSSWVKLADTASTSYVHKSVKNAKKYTYTIRCLSSSGATISDFNHSGWAITFIKAPAAPTLKNTKKGVQLTLKKVSGATKYRIYRKVGSGSWIKIADAKTSYVDKTAKKGTTYTYTVRCLNKNGKLISGFNNGASIKCVR